MTKELQADGDQETVSVELPAPAGWKKFISKKAGAPKRNEISFISPTGEEIRYKRQLDRYLRSHPGGPSSSQFDWGHGDTLRRSARLSEKAKEIEIPEEKPSKKQKTHLSSKKGTKKKKEGRDSDAEDYSPEAKRPKRREKHSTPKKRTKPKTKSVDSGIGDDEPETCKLDTEALESVKDAEMKEAEDISVEEKGEAFSAKAISEDSSAKVDSKDECKQENDGVIAEVEHNMPVSVKITTEEPESVEELDVKDSEAGSIEGIEGAAAKLDSNDGDKLNKSDTNADIEEALESEKISTQVLERLEDLDVKDVAKLDSNDVGAELKDEAPISENIATQVLNSEEDSDTQNVNKVGSNDNLDAEMNDGVPETEQIATQALECSEDSDMENVAKVDSNDDTDADAKNEGPEIENIATEVIKSAEDSDTKLDADVKIEALESEKTAAEVIKSVEDSDTKLDLEVKNEAPEIEKMVAEALQEPFEEDIHKADEENDKSLLNKNHKGEQASPSTAISNAKCRDLKSPEKAATIV